MKHYQMTEEELKVLLSACKSSPCMLVGDVNLGKSAQENANDAWKSLANKYKFKWNTARPDGNDPTKFIAEELEEELN